MYDNRRVTFKTGCCIPKEEASKEEPKPAVKEEKPAVKVGCRVESIVAISRVNGKIMVMYDDCTYTVADPKVLDEDICGAGEQPKLNLEPLTDLGGKDKAQVIALENFEN
jgi:hypothetical protein